MKQIKEGLCFLISLGEMLKCLLLDIVFVGVVWGEVGSVCGFSTLDSSSSGSESQITAAL